MSVFNSVHSYRKYAHSVIRISRFIWTEEIKDFLDTVLVTGRQRKEIIPKGSIFWRAQLGHDLRPVEIGENETTDFPAPFLPQRMKPLVDRAKEGRANPKGIPYLYCTDSHKTAIAEVRPGLGSLISVGQFSTKRNLSIVNFTNDSKLTHPIYFQEPDPPEREKAVWRAINNAFSEPINPSDELAEYIPTQIIAELFKNDGFEGLSYNSAFGNGHNLLFYDLDCADLINCGLYKLKKIDFEFSQFSNPYFIKDGNA